MNELDYVLLGLVGWVALGLLVAVLRPSLPPRGPRTRLGRARAAIQYVLVIPVVALGAMAGVRLSFGIMFETLSCQQSSLLKLSSCQAAGQELNRVMKLLGGGGVALMATGGLVLRQLQKEEVPRDAE